LAVADSSEFRVRRATTDDRESLKLLWRSMLLPADELEKRLTEFQVVETSDGNLLGAIGIQIVRQHARLHSESYLDFAHADAARQLFWIRVQTLASNHGVFRLWTQESSPFWSQLGFRSATAAKLADLPPEWQPAKGEWFMLQLKDEQAIVNALDKDFAAFMLAEKRNTQRTYEQARTLKTVITVIGFTIAILCFIVVGYLLIHRNPFFLSGH
jgi:N-acetylglutamate synthase-like GNAT family acetyltransferase